MVALFALLFTALPIVASAQSCPPVDRTELGARLMAAQDAVDRGDIERQASEAARLFDAVPCLDFAPTPREWADVLVNQAIGAFARNEPWEGLLATAVRLRPGVDRYVSAAHPIAAWEPPPQGGATRLLPEGVFVDGRAAQALPLDGAVHLVQRRSGNWWTSILLNGEDLPESWLTERVTGPSGLWLGARLSVGATAAGWVQAQRADVHSAWVRPSDVDGGGLAAAELTLSSRLPVGLVLRGRVGLSGLAAGAGDADVAAVWLRERGWFGLGFATLDAVALEGASGARRMRVSGAVLTARRSSDGLVGDVSLMLRPGGGSLDGRLGRRLRADSPWEAVVSVHGATLALAQRYDGAIDRVRWAQLDASLLVSYVVGGR